MRIFLFLTIIFIFSFSTIVFSSDELFIPMFGDDELYVSFDFGDLEINAFSVYPFCGNGVCEPGEECSVCPQDCGSCRQDWGGGGFKYYNIILSVLEDDYYSSQTISANFTLKLFAHETPRNDGVLEYFLINPRGEPVAKKRDVIREGDLSKILSLQLPSEPELGVWRFEVVWDAERLLSMSANDYFEVLEPPLVPKSNIGLIIFIILLACVIGFFYHKKVVLKKKFFY